MPKKELPERLTPSVWRRQDAAVGRAWQFAPGFSKVMTVANNELTAVVEGKQTVNGMLAKVQEAANDALR